MSTDNARDGADTQIWQRPFWAPDWLARFINERWNSPFVRQLPISVLFLGVMAVVALAPELDYRDVGATIASLVVLGIAVVVAVIYTVRPLPCPEVVPLISIAAVALARVGVGPSMTMLFVVCMLWFALSESARWTLIGTGAIFVAVLLPYIWPGSAETFTGLTLIEIVGAPLVSGYLAAIVHGVVADNRRRLRTNAQLVAERETALNDAVDLVRRLRENEAQLESAGHLFRSVLDSVTRQSVIGTDLSGLIDVWNTGAESMLGMSSDEVIGKRFIHEFHREDELEARAEELGYPAGATVLNPGFSALVEVARLGGSEDRDWTYLKGNGEALAAHVAVTPRIDENGRTVGYIFVGTDVSDVKELAKLQDEFVGLVSHELRTPVSSILGYLELMRDSTDPLSEEQLHYLGVAERNAHRLLRLVGDLLFTAQVAAHKFPIESAETDVNAIVAASVESARPASQAANVLLLSNPADGRPIVNGDATRIAQACDNLLSNAIKFTPRGGTVTVSVESLGSVVRISVRDTGMGIPPDEIAMLSTRFFRASTATRAAVQGVGLGLSITKAIVTAHGGSLSAESEVGVGTVFMFTLPLLRVDD
ncbi:ATP-binding protein [Salinibacterium sp. SYSU T00001]|uniref:ATP-binding protein n=1 Tax=Homoserinimonas sedimenticola TaxID=2986805 RepID=UPI002236AE24|nr:ATP-binding protein [Salinibacterium sedimenticola]MCW4386552.1 ATP-binding protein [Salinibacterium sedimenticola]